MGLDGELTAILREVVQFLECLREVKLPVALESIRDNLLVRSKETLTMFMVERIGRSGSPEAYLDMNAARSKGLLTALKTDSETEEYVGTDKSTSLMPQDYYETFQNAGASNENTEKRNGVQVENALFDIYSNFSAVQTKSNCFKCGLLDRKEGRKLFVFEQYRTYWVGLVSLHLLIYASDRDSRPCTVLPIRGYMARAAPNAIPRDQRKSEATFEMFRPGCRTFQFVARTPQDMEQWVSKICELAEDEKKDVGERSKILTSVSTKIDASTAEDQESDSVERYQDVGPVVSDKTVAEDPPIVADVSNESSEATIASPSKEPPPDIVDSVPPPLPARIPRRLPSLPVRNASVYPEEEDDEIYHRIEDLRDSAHCYGNISKDVQVKAADSRKTEIETYDDIGSNIKEDSRNEEKAKKIKNRDSGTTKSANLQNEVTYDDALSAVSPKELASYDDVESLISNAKTTKPQNAAKTEKVETVEVAKSPQKKSFLDRVRSRRDSPKKVEKKMKRKTPTPPPAIVQELPTYDDATVLINTQENKQNIEEESEYNFPPPPRPVYANLPPPEESIDCEELYDDVSACREKYKDEDLSTCKVEQVAANLQQTPKKFNYVPNSGRVDNMEYFVPSENTNTSQQLFEDTEHYQTPRSESICKYLPTDQQEELYDDIAILADFTARQKENLGRKDGEDAAKTEKRSRNRFVNGKKSKIDSIGETNSLRSSGTEDTDDADEQHGLLRMNTFQKLISKMENSLGKASVKIAPSMLLNKTNVTNNA